MHKKNNSLINLKQFGRKGKDLKFFITEDINLEKMEK